MGNCLHRNKPRTTYNISPSISIRSESGDEEFNETIDRRRRDSLRNVGTDQVQMIHDNSGSIEINELRASYIEFSDDFRDEFIGENEVNISFEDDTADCDDVRIYLDGNSCEICANEYDEINHKPVILPCGHVFCLNCVKTICKNNGLHFVECPLDRKIHVMKNRPAVESPEGLFDDMGNNLPTDEDERFTISDGNNDENSDAGSVYVDGRHNTDLTPYGIHTANIGDDMSNNLPTDEGERFTISGGNSDENSDAGSIYVDGLLNTDLTPNGIHTAHIGDDNEIMFEDLGIFNTQQQPVQLFQSHGGRLVSWNPNEPLKIPRPSLIQSRSNEQNAYNTPDIFNVESIQDNDMTPNPLRDRQPRHLPRSYIQDRTPRDIIPVVMDVENQEAVYHHLFRPGRLDIPVFSPRNTNIERLTSHGRMPVVTDGRNTVGQDTRRKEGYNGNNIIVTTTDINDFTA